MRSKKNLLTYLFIILYSCNTYATGFDIEDFYIEAKGNNVEEARFKAQVHGFERAFFIMLDKLNLSSTSMRKANYLEIKNTIEKAVYYNDRSESTQYSAFANYLFDYEKLLNLVKLYGDINSLNRLNEIIVITVFKQGNNFFVMDENDIYWSKIWFNSRDILKQRKIIIPTKKELSSVLINDIMSLDYNLLKPLMRKYLASKAVIIIAEHNTVRSNGELDLMIEYRYMNYSNFYVKNEKYPILVKTNLPLLVNRVINDFSNKYGRVINYSELNSDNNIRRNNLMPKVVPQVRPSTLQKTITLYYETHNQKDWDDLQILLSKISEIEEVMFVGQEGNYILLSLTYRTNKQNLVNELFLNNLTYVNRDEKSYLIEIERGM